MFAADDYNRLAPHPVVAEYSFKDHVGNTRLLMNPDGAGIMQASTYYPYGLRIGGLHQGLVDATGPSTNEELYNGKELTVAHGRNGYHDGAKFYDVEIARWTTIDPADPFRTPYTYVDGGDPVNLIDPDGRQATSVTIATEQDNRAVLRGEMSHAEHRARREARAEGARVGIEMLADTAGDLFELVTGYTVTLDEGNRGAAAAALGLPGVSSRALKSLTHIVENVRVISFGDVVYEGTVDLEPTIRRIDAGEKHPHKRDATEFRNDPGRLPSKPAGHYREYVHPTPSVDGVRPQRIVIGKDGEAFYTPDHYKTFIPLHK